MKTKPLSNLRDSEKGNCLVVLCNGPSIKGHEDLILELIKDMDLMACNGWFRMPFYGELKPKWLFYLDGGYRKRYAQDVEVNKEAEHLVSGWTEWDVCSGKGQPYHFDLSSYCVTGMHMLRAAYALGYAQVHLFGWTCSSFRGEGWGIHYYDKQPPRSGRCEGESEEKAAMVDREFRRTLAWFRGGEETDR